MDTFTMPMNDKICGTIPDKIKNKIHTNKTSTFEAIESNLKSIPLQSGGKQFGDKNNPSEIAIIIPYRNRERNLKLFLEYMHQFLAEQHSNFGIYLVEPAAYLKFNRALLLNIGYKEAMRDHNWNCIIFHDIDLLPENNLNIYSCDKSYPMQMAISISVYDYVVTGYFKDKYFGGINAFTPEQFENVNGFSNSYFDWGIEDDDLLLRVKSKYDSIKRLEPSIGRYFANCHGKQTRNPNRFILYMSAKNRIKKDGLNSLQYNVEQTERRLLFTRFYVTYDDKP